jgi:hypothetical protein
MQHDLLMDAAHMVYAVNCQEQDDALHCGALFLEPLIPFKSIRLAYETASVMVELPDELVNQPEPFRSWSIDLPLVHV